MEIKKSDKYCIITPLSPKLNAREAKRLSDELNCYSNFDILGLDLSLVSDCTIEFIETIKGFGNVGLFNIQSDIFALLTSMNLDKSLKLFVSEIDFLNNSHRLINRKFSIV